MVIPPESLGYLDVILLGLLSPSPEQNDLVSIYAEIDSVSAAKVNSEFNNSLSNRTVVSEVSFFRPLQTYENSTQYFW